MPVQRLREFLDAEGVRYVVISHSPAFTAQQVATSAHIPGKDLAKTVMVKLDGRMAMAVLPASRRADLSLLRETADAQNVELAGESEFRERFPDCEVGAMPPFGNLYDMDVYVDESLAEDDQIAFNAGSHTELVAMGYRDFERLVQPRVLRFGVPV